MLIKILKSMIQELIVSESNVDCPGSIFLPDELLKASGIKQFEFVCVNNKTNGNSIVTYAVRSKQNGFVSLNGPASELFSKGDAIHVLAFNYLTEKEAETFNPTLVITDVQNRIMGKGAFNLNRSFQVV